MTKCSIPCMWTLELLQLHDSVPSGNLSPLVVFTGKVVDFLHLSVFVFFRRCSVDSFWYVTALLAQVQSILHLQLTLTENLKCFLMYSLLSILSTSSCSDSEFEWLVSPSASVEMFCYGDALWQPLFNTWVTISALFNNRNLIRK